MSYVREIDGTLMIEIAPWQFLNAEIAKALGIRTLPSPPKEKGE